MVKRTQENHVIVLPEIFCNFITCALKLLTKILIESHKGICMAGGKGNREQDQRVAWNITQLVTANATMEGKVRFKKTICHTYKN